MKYVDLHSDYLYKLNYEDDSTIYQSNLEQLMQGECTLQTYAILFDRQSITDIDSYYKCMLNIFHQFLTENEKKVALAKNYNDILENTKLNKISAVLSIEDGQLLCESPKNVKRLYDDGVRLATILWDGQNDFGYSYKEDLPLKSKGIETIGEMEDTGIIIDVSHLSDKGFEDVNRITKKPFIATHSNTRELTNHHRNLTNSQIKTISEKGGIIGINFFSKYIDTKKIDENSESKIEYIISHIKQIIKCGGEDCVAFGQDFDGVPNASISKSEIYDATKMPYLYQKLQYVFKDELLEKIFYKNALRFFKENLK